MNFSPDTSENENTFLYGCIFLIGLGLSFLAICTIVGIVVYNIVALARGTG